MLFFAYPELNLTAKVVKKSDFSKKKSKKLRNCKRFSNFAADKVWNVEIHKQNQQYKLNSTV